MPGPVVSGGLMLASEQQPAGTVSGKFDGRPANMIGPHDRPRGTREGQASTQTPSWRARPSASSRRRLTAATRSDHHTWLRSMPR